MLSEKKIIDVINSSTADKKNFAEFLCDLYKDKVVEIYFGDEYEQINVDQISTSYPCILCGKIIGAYGNCLIINCIYVDQITKKACLGNIICINDFHIKVIKEVDKQGMIQDTFLRNKDSIIIKSVFGENEIK